MLENDLRETMEYMGELFPAMAAELSGAEREAWADTLKRYRRGDVMGALRACWNDTKYSRIRPREIHDQVRKLRVSTDPQLGRPRRQMKTIDWLRGPENEATYAGLSDIDAIVTHFQLAWGRSMEESEPGRTFVRGKIGADCFNALLQIGTAKAMAGQLAREVVEMAEGEKLRLAWVGPSEPGESALPVVELQEARP